MLFKIRYRLRMIDSSPSTLALLLRLPFIGIWTGLSLLALPVTVVFFVPMVVLSPSPSTTASLLCSAQVWLGVAVIARTTCVRVAVSGLMRLVIYAANLGALFPHTFIIHYILCPLHSRPLFRLRS